MQKIQKHSTDIHLKVLQMIKSAGVVSKVKIKEFIAEEYSNREITQLKIINKLRSYNFIEERKGADNLKYLCFVKGK